MSDQEVAEAVGRKAKWVAEVLTNPLYIGKLRDGQPSAVGPVVDLEVWSAVQTRREARRTREPGRELRAGEYALRVRCLGCGTYLRGDTRRYRHPAPVCAEFAAAKPDQNVAVRGRHHSTAGHSYAQTWYEGVAGLILARAGEASDDLIQTVLAARAVAEPRIDEVTLARIARDRDEATRRLTDSRDVVAWQATMARLDAEEATARTDTGARLSDEEVTSYLRNLPALWTDADPGARKSMATALWDDFAALGWREVRYTWSAQARGLGLGELVPGRFTPSPDDMVFGRGERI